MHSTRDVTHLWWTDHLQNRRQGRSRACVHAALCARRFATSVGHAHQLAASGANVRGWQSGAYAPRETCRMTIRYWIRCVAVIVCMPCTPSFVNASLYAYVMFACMFQNLRSCFAQLLSDRQVSIVAVACSKTCACNDCRRSGFNWCSGGEQTEAGGFCDVRWSSAFQVIADTYAYA
jgi:hypothetical protein